MMTEHNLVLIEFPTQQSKTRALGRGALFSDALTVAAEKDCN